MDIRALRIALALLAGFTVLEIVAALLAGSLALRAHAGHMLTDAAALAAALWAIRSTTRPVGAAESSPRPRAPKSPIAAQPSTFGAGRAFREL